MRDLGLTLAGGGSRAFYAQGLLDVWGHRVWPRVAAVGCCSAGAAAAVMLLSGRADRARARWDGLRQGIEKNLDLSRVLRGERIAPHEAMYRSAMREALADGGFERIKALPFPVDVLCTIAPRRVPLAIATWLGFGAYALEKQREPSRLHPRAGRALGYRELVFDARDCETPAELTDLVLASSATPPFTPIGRFRGFDLLDGGVIDNAPAHLVERHTAVKKNLVVLSRPYPGDVDRERGGRWYVAPSAPVPVERWDFSKHARIDPTIALGALDGRTLEARLSCFLNDGSLLEQRSG